MYEPQEDSELLAEFVFKIIKRYKPVTFLDMGCGSGIQSRTAIKAGINKKDILATDLNKKALEETKKLGVNIRKSNLFSKIKEKFDLIAFNPPYLPENQYDQEKDLTGGKKGWEITAKFLEQTKEHLNKNGKILLIFSSVTNKRKVEELVKKNKFNFKYLTKKQFFMETIYLIILER